jgi:hypothetical protein
MICTIQSLHHNYHFLIFYNNYQLISDVVKFFAYETLLEIHDREKKVGPQLLKLGGFWILQDERRKVDEEILMLLPLYLTKNCNSVRYLNLCKN